MKRMVGYCDVNREDIVLEIGAGLGNLTTVLAKTAGEVLAVELDHHLVEALQGRLGNLRNVRVIEGDILDLRASGFQKIVSNPPYSISSSLLLLILGWRFTCAILTLQQEFAAKLKAKKGDEEYCPLTVLTNYKTTIEVLEHVPRNSFYPQPKVESVVLQIRLQPPAFHVRDEEVFQNLVKALFTQRNRKAKNGLGAFLRNYAGASKEELAKLLEGKPFLDRRIRELAPKEFADLANKITDLAKSKRIVYDGKSFYVFPEVYEPSEDSFLLARYVDARPRERVLDMGTGCGLLGVLAARRGAEVLAVDINPHAVECSRLNAKLNGVSDKFEAAFSDLFENLGEERFNLIIFNPPYLPTEKRETPTGWLEKAWQGGESGREVIERFIQKLCNHLEEGGRVMMVLSSLSSPEETVMALTQRGFEVEKICEERLDFESLTVLRAAR